jgi:CheY-like chemotaxis protein
MFDQTEPSRIKLLVVEDEEFSRNVMSRQLKNFFYADFAVNGNHALELFTKNSYDVILMDINLGVGKNGIKIMQEIRETEKGQNIPVIAITAYANFGDKESFLNAGFDNYISKPYNTDALIRCIMDSLNVYVY